MALYNKAIRRLTKHIKQNLQKEVEKELGFEKTKKLQKNSQKMESEKLIGTLH